MLFIVATLVIIVCMGITPGKVLNNKVSYWFGELSFVLCFVHVPIYETTHQVILHDDNFGGNTMDFIIPFVVSLIVSIGYVFISKSIKIKRKGKLK